MRRPAERARYCARPRGLLLQLGMVKPDGGDNLVIVCLKLLEQIIVSLVLRGARKCCTIWGKSSAAEMMGAVDRAAWHGSVVWVPDGVWRETKVVVHSGQ